MSNLNVHRPGSGGDRGGRRPRIWRSNKDGSAQKMKSMSVPFVIHESVLKVAHLLDSGKITLEQIEALIS